jgi:hypothetical protein
VELSPAIAEWLGWQRVRKVLVGMTVAATVFGITLSTLHQSALGALYMMAKPKIHPLWYSEFIPVLFFVSSIYAGLCMVIFEGSISHRVFHARLSPTLIKSHDSIVLSLAKIGGAALFVNLFLEGLKFLHGRLWLAFSGGWAAWYLVEVIGFGVLPMVLLLRGSLARNLRMVKIGALMGLLGVILNRLNLSVIAFKWYESAHYVPSWMEIVCGRRHLGRIWVFGGSCSGCRFWPMSTRTRGAPSNSGRHREAVGQLAREGPVWSSFRPRVSSTSGDRVPAAAGAVLVVRGEGQARDSGARRGRIGPCGQRPRMVPRAGRLPLPPRPHVGAAGRRRAAARGHGRLRAAVPRTTAGVRAAGSRTAPRTGRKGLEREGRRAGHLHALAGPGRGRRN